MERVSNITMNSPINETDSFQLAERYKAFNGYGRLRFYVEENKYVIRLTECDLQFRMPITGHGGRRLCDCCKSLSANVAHIFLQRFPKGNYLFQRLTIDGQETIHASRRGL